MLHSSIGTITASRLYNLPRRIVNIVLLSIVIVMVCRVFRFYSSISQLIESRP